jgi:hypothetical protein
MTASPCPGTSCNGRYWKAWDDYDKALAGYDPLNPETSRPEQPDVRWRADGNPVWCSECTARIRRELASLDDLASLLLRTADGYEGTPRTEKVGGSSEPGSPSPAADQLDEMDRLLRLWEDGYRKLRGWDSAPRRGDDADRRTTSIAWLTAHLDGILGSAYALEFGGDVLDWRKALAGSTKAGVRKLRMPLRCPKPGGCGLLTLTWTEGSDRVECRNPGCGFIMSREKYEAEVSAQAAALEAGETTETRAAGHAA